MTSSRESLGRWSGSRLNCNLKARLHPPTANGPEDVSTDAIALASHRRPVTLQELSHSEHLQPPPPRAPHPGIERAHRRTGPASDRRRMARPPLTPDSLCVDRPREVATSRGRLDIDHDSACVTPGADGLAGSQHRAHTAGHIDSTSCPNRQISMHDEKRAVTSTRA
jgi:hypothetical protein